METAEKEQVPALHYSTLLSEYPWIVERGQNCIVSPDSDGLLCGLLMSHVLGWHVRGFYDTKVLFMETGYHMEDCVFLDVEIFRKSVRSIGQHMLMHHAQELPSHWKELEQCISPNNIRGFDFSEHFKEKYPLGTIHLLLAIIANRHPVVIESNAIIPLLYTDGTFKNMFNYPENVLNWLEWLGANEPGNPLGQIFFREDATMSDMMFGLRDLFATFRKFKKGRIGGDKIRISNAKSEPLNIDDRCALDQETIFHAETLLRMLGEKTGWIYNKDQWSWGPYEIVRFKKESVQRSKGRYYNMMKKNPLSLAITAQDRIEYTLDAR